MPCEHYFQNFLYSDFKEYTFTETSLHESCFYLMFQIFWEIIITILSNLTKIALQFTGKLDPKVRLSLFKAETTPKVQQLTSLSLIRMERHTEVSCDSSHKLLTYPKNLSQKARPFMMVCELFFSTCQHTSNKCNLPANYSLLLKLYTLQMSFISK